MSRLPIDDSSSTHGCRLLWIAALVAFCVVVGGRRCLLVKGRPLPGRARVPRQPPEPRQPAVSRRRWRSRRRASCTTRRRWIGGRSSRSTSRTSPRCDRHEAVLLERADRELSGGTSPVRCHGHRKARRGGDEAADRAVPDPSTTAAQRPGAGRRRPAEADRQIGRSDLQRATSASASRHAAPSRRSSKRGSTRSCSRRCAPACCASCARGPDEAFDVEALMQTFGRMRLDVENCVRELVDFGVAAARAGRRPAALRVRSRPTSDALRDLLDEFLERRATVSHEDRSPSVQRFREMIGRDEKMLVVFEWIRTAAKSDISVLILGPTGSGKEVVARMIHELSRRGTQQVPGGQLRGAARHAVRVGDLRLREGRVHRRARSQAGPARAGQQRHAVPRRDRRHVAHRAGQAAARARGAPLRAARRQQVDRGRTSG